jgi:hypothetical protein
MPTHIAIQPGRLYPQPGYTLKIDKEGKWTATQIFLCHRSSAVALMPRPGSGHPEVPFITTQESRVRGKPTEAREVNDIGNIATRSGTAPELAGGRNWLLNGVTQTQEGKAFRLENEWLASDRGGWDAQIYND